MDLNLKNIKYMSHLREKGYELPEYDIEKMRKNTEENPEWVHFGAGNIFRAFHADIADGLLKRGLMNTGIIVAEGFDQAIIDMAYRPFDNLSILVTLKSDGTVNKKIIGSIADSLVLDLSTPDGERLKEIFKKKSLKLATFTITEKGYSYKNSDGSVFENIKSDLSAIPTIAKSYIGMVTALLYERFLNGRLPIALVSTDNCSENGKKLHDVIEFYVKSWVDNGLAEKGFLDYINDPSYVSFPLTMIDKITPRPDEAVYRMLTEDRFSNMEPLITTKHTFVAPFVNAEESGYLVIEDNFPNGRPEMSKSGVFFTDRETVRKVEKMKVSTALNPLHTALAVFGCLLRINKISDEMSDPDLRKMVEILGEKEGLPVVTDPGIINPREFLYTVLNVRLNNPFMPDTPERIATDTSRKLSVRFGETVKNYKSHNLDLTNLKIIPLVYAGWLRYLMAIDDKGNTFTLSPDPKLDELTEKMKEFSLTGAIDSEKEKVLSDILSDEEIFGLNLNETILAREAIEYFKKMIAGPGAIRNTIHSVVNL